MKNKIETFIKLTNITINSHIIFIIRTIEKFKTSATTHVEN